MATIAEWLREKTGMSTPEEKRKRGEDPDSKRKKEMDKAAGDGTSPKEGKDAGEIGKKWEETFDKK